MKFTNTKSTASWKALLAAALVATGLTHGQANAGPEPFIGEISWFGGNFAPRGWAYCDGQLLAINQHQALFSILGTTYGGDGRTTFGLPDMRSRSPVHAGSGSGLTTRRLGEKGGAETTTLTVNQLPSHSHQLIASADTANAIEPNDAMIAVHDTPLQGNAGNEAFTNGTPTSTATMATGSIGSTGGGQPINNVHPFSTINCIIALEGIFPSRN